MKVALFLIGLVLMAAWAGICFWLAARYQRRELAAGRKPKVRVMRNLVVAGAGCVIMFFIVIFWTLNPPPASLETMRP
jgi:hypothetical protein